MKKIVISFLMPLILLYLTVHANPLEQPLQPDTKHLIPPSYVNSLKESYSKEELKRIELDLGNLRELYFLKAKPVEDASPLYIASAGGPGGL